MRLALLLLTAATFAATVPALADGDPAPGAVESVIDDARLRDDLRGVTSDPAKEVRVEFAASAGSRLVATLTGDGTQGVPSATGLSLVVCAADGTDLEVAGGLHDRSRAARDEVRYRRVPLESTGRYVLIVRVTGAGGWRLRLARSRLAVTRARDASEPDTVLDVDETDTVSFDGLAGGTARFALRPPRRGRFRGRLVSVQRPDGSFLTGPPEAASGRLALDADGTHTLLFANAGRAGAWRARVTSRPPPLRLRRGYVGVNETALVPRVLRVTPGRGVQRDTALRVLARGRDFQPGPEVRLVRNGRDPILATDVDVLSETEMEFTLDLDTTDSAGKNSIGLWRVGVWNRPRYADPEDRLSLIEDSPARDTRKRFRSVSSGTVKLPRGVKPDTEVWYLDFNAGFQFDLNRMGLGASDRFVREITREIVKAYVVAYLRDLFRVDETTGNAGASGAVKVSFVVSEPPSIAGQPGVAYNRIEIGGAWQEGDPSDEPLPWGHVPDDPGNAGRVNAAILDAAGTRIGLGARLRVLDPDGADASVSFRDFEPLAALRRQPLGAGDVVFFSGGFNPNDTRRVARYADIVLSVERASREIAAIVGHHIGRAMGLASGGDGPMAAPSSAGDLWPERGDLVFASGDAATLRTNAVPHDLPGRSDALRVDFFPLQDQRPTLLMNASTGAPYLQTGDAFEVSWEFVGGRANARPGDYRMQYVRGSNPPLDMELTFETLAGTARTCIQPGVCQNANDIYFDVSRFQLAVTDTVNETVTFHYHELNVVPDPLDFPTQGGLRQAAQQKRDLVLNR